MLHIGYSDDIHHKLKEHFKPDNIQTPVDRHLRVLEGALTRKGWTDRIFVKWIEEPEYEKLGDDFIKYLESNIGANVKYRHEEEF